MMDSQQLLAEYAQTGSDAVFRELAARYVDLVYSTAVRLTYGDTHRAEDVVQIVFADLAGKARTLSKDVMLGGWLHRHTCYVVANTMRGERRRQERERQAVEMNALHDDLETDFSQIAPILDEAINELDEADRTAVLLRFYEQRDFRVVGDLIGSNENAARMRVNRALEKLEGLLKRRGVTTSAAALAVVLSANSIQAAPAGLVMSISTATATGSGIKTAVMAGWQKGLLAGALVAVIGVGVYEAGRPSQGQLSAVVPIPMLEIKGHFNVNKTDRAEWGQPFEIICDGKQWQIKILGQNKTNGIPLTQVVFDGTDIYSLSVYRTNPPDGPTRMKNDATGTVETRKIPEFGGMKQPLWLAYCSGEFFAPGSDWRFPELMRDRISTSPKNLKFLKAKGTLLAGPLTLPERMVFWNEGKMMVDKLGEAFYLPQKSLDQLPPEARRSMQGGRVVSTSLSNAPAPYDQGFTNLVYEVLEKTNVAGVTVPLHFVLTIFRMKPDGKSAADLQQYMVINGVADSVSTSTNAIVLPVIGPRTMVLDGRSPPANRESMEYYPTNNHWLSPGEAREVEVRARKAKKTFR